MKTETHFVREPSLAAVRASLVPAVAVVLAIAGILAVYWQTGWSMVTMWIRSDTFTHGFVVLPLSIWLVWRERAALAAIPARPFWPALAGIAAAGGAWLLGELASVDVVRQIAMVAMVVLAVPAVAGLAVARTLAFPLGFLFFAVPVGEFLIPPFIDWTGDFTVKALQLSGIPVYREGNFFVIPSGRWSVVAGCSGVRYLIASFMAGTFYAYLTYRTAWRRLAFVGASIAVPIVANWLRAYMIVMLGHLSDNRIAADVDHLIYGWVFFGVVIMLMFWIGARWREDEPLSAIGQHGAIRFSLGASGAPVRGNLLAAAAAAALVASLWRPVGFHLDERVGDAAVALAAAPGRAGWERESVPAIAWTPAFVGARAADHALYSKGGRKVGVHIAYYRRQSQGTELINSANVLVRDSEQAWHQVARGTAQLSWAGEPLAVETAVLKGRAADLAVRRWYWVDGRFTSNEYVAKALLALAKLSGRGDDSAAIVLYAPFRDAPGEATAALESFAREMGPAIDEALARAASRSDG